MKYIVTLIWGFILGHVAYYIGGALVGNPYDFVKGSLLGFVIAIAVAVLASLFPKTDSTSKSH